MQQRQMDIAMYLDMDDVELLPHIVCMTTAMLGCLIRSALEPVVRTGALTDYEEDILCQEDRVTLFEFLWQSDEMVGTYFMFKWDNPQLCTFVRDVLIGGVLRYPPP